MNDIIVAKFGGSSLSDSGQFRKVKKIIDEDKRRRYVIPSAPGKRYKDDEKITDILYKCHFKSKIQEEFDIYFGMIEERFTEIVRELYIDLDIEKYLKEVRYKILSGESIDYAASRGEYLNGLILSKYLNIEFVDAKEVIFFDKYGRFDPEKTNYVLKHKLSNIKRAVIPGFYGSMPDGSIKTFSRGGSDITGSIVARGVDAYLYENWTDVSGFLMADPRIVENPKLIERVTYRELRELSYMGASVLHEEAIFPVRQAAIPINIKNTNSPEYPGTLIEDDSKSKEKTGMITGIAGRKDFTVITIEKNMMNAEIGFGRKLLSILENYMVSFEHMPSGIDTVSLVIEQSKLEGKIEEIIQEIKKELNPDSVTVSPNIALIATVGKGMSETVGMTAKIFDALKDAGIKVKMIDQGSSGINVIIGVENSDFENAVRSIYNAFV